MWLVSRRQDSAVFAVQPKAWAGAACAMIIAACGGDSTGPPLTDENAGGDSTRSSPLPSMNTLDRCPPVFEGILYPGGLHDSSTLTGSTGRMSAWIETLWP